jgi:hypothetical protein
MDLLIKSDELDIKAWSSTSSAKTGTVLTNQERGGKHILYMDINQGDSISIYMTKDGCFASTTQVIDI